MPNRAVKHTATAPLRNRIFASMSVLSDGVAVTDAAGATHDCRFETSSNRAVVVRIEAETPDDGPLKYVHLDPAAGRKLETSWTEHVVVPPRRPRRPQQEPTSRAGAAKGITSTGGMGSTGEVSATFSCRDYQSTLWVDVAFLAITVPVA